MRTRVVGVVAAGAATLLAGCGGSSPVAPVAAGDVSQLRQDVRAIRTAAGAGRPARAHQAVAALRIHVEQLILNGRLSLADGRRLLLVAGHVDDRISVQVHPVGSTPSSAPPTNTQTTARPTAQTTPPLPAAKPRSDNQNGGGGDGHSGGHGQGHGHGGD
jgi:hypothetical protein